jgi:formylglycine-generating enzyme required for sulfatase activity
VTRARSLTSRHYGETEELLPKYAWYLKNSPERSRPVGSLKPNDFGLFDVHGNVFNWCQERPLNYPQGQVEKEKEDKEDILNINSNDSRAMRGGSHFNPASFIRSAFRNDYVPGTRTYSMGFRPARTYR